MPRAIRYAHEMKIKQGERKLARRGARKILHSSNPGKLPRIAAETPAEKKWETWKVHFPEVRESSFARVILTRLKVIHQKKRRGATRNGQSNTPSNGDSPSDERGTF